jgi:hypothetical protein
VSAIISTRTAQSAAGTLKVDDLNLPACDIVPPCCDEKTLPHSRGVTGEHKRVAASAGRAGRNDDSFVNTFAPQHSAG